jgi:hypothetical protein
MPREVFMQTRMALEYAMRSIQANQDGFKSKGTHLIPV